MRADFWVLFMKYFSVKFWRTVPKTKKCAAEATHRKMPRSDCCHTTFSESRKLNNFTCRAYEKKSEHFYQR